MSIRFACEHCQSKLNVADKYGGKRVKCPKCAQPIKVPAAEADPGEDLLAPIEPAAPAAGGWGQGTRTHLDDLLDEAGVKEAVTGPTCPACGSEITEGALICIECGYNFESGEQMATMMSQDTLEEGGSETDRMLRKAEKELDESPMHVDEGGFGDGPEAFLIAFGALIGGAFIVGAIVFVIFLFDRITEAEGMTILVTFVMCLLFHVIGRLWIIIVSFFEGPGHGFGTLLCNIYAYIYGFSRFGNLWMPTFLMLMGEIGLFVVQMMMAFGGEEGAG